VSGNNRYVIGLNCSGFISSACLVKDGVVVSAICEERISRLKRDKNFPVKAIKYVCDSEKISLKQVDKILIGWNPRFYLQKSDNMLNDAFKDRGKIAYLSLNELATLNQENIPNTIEQKLIYEDHTINIEYVDHHKAHLSNGYALSGFKNSDFLILDGFGENTTGMCGTIEEGKIDVYEKYSSPHSMGSFYSTFTDFLNFRPNSDEWKVMALSPMGDKNVYYEQVKNMVKVDGLKFELDLSYFEHFLFFTKNYYSEKFLKEFKEIGEKTTLTKQHYDLVASCQKVSEEVVLKILNNLHKKTKNKNLILGGGFFMNSLLNGKILDNTPYENLQIGGSPDDSGISIGAAMYEAIKTGQNKYLKVKNNYFGIEYSESEIEKELKKRKLKYKKSNNIFKEAAEAINDGKIIGWFQGKSEFGQRALGNRSILANPSLKTIKDSINKSIKYREKFRPFAPSVLKSHQDKIFKSAVANDSYFMERVLEYKDGWDKKLPGTDHFKTGRLQTVDEQENERYYKLINEFYKISGIPCVLNTSFNVNGMPMVESPADAISCFFNSGIDYLVLGDFILEK